MKYVEEHTIRSCACDHPDENHAFRIQPLNPSAESTIACTWCDFLGAITPRGYEQLPADRPRIADFLAKHLNVTGGDPVTAARAYGSLNAQQRDDFMLEWRKFEATLKR